MLSCSNYAHVLLLQRHMEALQKFWFFLMLLIANWNSMLEKTLREIYAGFSKVQIQEKEKVCMIQADPPIWDNIIKVSLLPCFCKFEIFIVCCHFLLYCASPNHYISWPAGQTYFSPNHYISYS
ncbi:hypothetical protein ACJX0J_039816 [Zea mays]